MEPEKRQRWQDWNEEQIDGIVIVDPDGFRTGDPMADRYSWTRAEFLERRALCTVRSVVSKSEGRRIIHTTGVHE